MGSARGPAPLYLDQNEAQRAENCWVFFSHPPPPPSYLRAGLDNRPPPLSEGLDRPLYVATKMNVVKGKHGNCSSPI